MNIQLNLVIFKGSWTIRPCKISRWVSNKNGVIWAGTCLHFHSQKRKPIHKKITYSSKKHRSKWTCFFYPPLAVNNLACWIQRWTSASFARSEVKNKFYAASNTFQITIEYPHTLWWTLNQAIEVLTKRFPCYCLPFTIRSLSHPLKGNYLRIKQFSFNWSIETR